MAEKWQIVACTVCKNATFWARRDPLSGRGQVLCRSCDAVLCEVIVVAQEYAGNKVPT